MCAVLHPKTSKDKYAMAPRKCYLDKISAHEEETYQSAKPVSVLEATTVLSSRDYLVARGTSAGGTYL